MPLLHSGQQLLPHEKYRGTKQAQSVNIASDGMSYPSYEPRDPSRLQPQRETYQKEGHANLVEEHHRPALTALLRAAGPDATDQC